MISYTWRRRGSRVIWVRQTRSGRRSRGQTCRPIRRGRKPISSAKPVKAGGRSADIHRVRQRRWLSVTDGRRSCPVHLKSKGKHMHPPDQRNPKGGIKRLFGRIAALTQWLHRASRVAAERETLSAPRPAEAGRPPWGSSKVAKPHLLESAPRPAEAGRPPWGSSKVAKPHLLERACMLIKSYAKAGGADAIDNPPGNTQGRPRGKLSE